VQKALIDTLKIDNLFAKAEILQEIAYSTPGKNRVIGSLGHEKTVAYIKSQLDTNYYDVSLQGVELSVGINATLTANNKTIEAYASTLAPAGKATGPLVAIPNLGCEEVRNRKW
jgi:hypothetical protein